MQIEVPVEDLHGVAFCESDRGGLYVLGLGRVSNDIALIDLTTFDVDSVWSIERPWLPDPKPDLGILEGDQLYMTLRGPRPISAITALTNPDRIPAIGAVTINPQCRPVRLRPKDIASIADLDRTATLPGGEEVTVADPHGIEIVPLID